jgi:pimeloyl-ACP methyl ester carboxylesterase
MGPPQDLYMRVKDFNIRYWAKGDQGSPVVLIHGIGGYIENWEPSVEPLAAQHRVYAFDWPGQGRSDKPLGIPCTIADLAHFTRDFMTALNIEHAHVAGHSLGGAIATRLTLLYPTAVDKLVLVAPAGLGKGIAPALGLWQWPLLGELLTQPSRPFSDRFNKLAVLDPALITDEIVEFDYQMTLLPGWQRCFL